MEKKRWIAWALALFMVATPCMTFAQEISGAAGSANESESNEPVKPDKASEQDCGNAAESEKGDSSAESAKDSEEGATGEQDSAKEKKTEESAAAEASKEATKAAENTGSEAVSDKWTITDFTYGEYEKLMYGCDYSRQFYVRGKVITGFSKQGEEKLKNNKNLVIPAKGPDGKNIVGIGESAFKEKGLESVQFPTGMLTPYDDPLAKTDEERVSRRGNFVIGESSFYGNKLKEVVLPTGVISVLAKAFEQNQIVKVKLPKTIWWIESQGFADNKITDVQFPVTTDFMMELHGMPFAFNNIKSVRLPNFTEVVNKTAFAFNPGMTKAPEKDPWGKENILEKEFHKETRTAGLVYMYTDNPGLKDKLQNRLHSVEGKNTNIYSPYQKLVVCDGLEANQNPDKTLWNAKDFVYDKDGAVTGLSESGIAKRKVNKDLVIPSKTPDGKKVEEIGSTDSYTGLFATEDEKFDSVYMPNTIQKIGDRAFCNSGLKEVAFSGTLTSIGMLAFSNNELTSVILPDSVKYMGNGAFSTNSNIERIILSKNLKKIPDAAFGCSDKYHYMSNLTEIEIPDTVTKIGSRAFAGNNIHNIVIPESVKEIGEYAFSTKNYLNESCAVTLSEGLEVIGDNAFRNKAIAEIDLPSTVKGLKLNTFRKEYTSDGHKVNGSITKVYVRNAEQYYDKKNFPDPKEETEAFHKLYLADPMTWTSDDYTYSKEESGANEITGFSPLGERKLTENKDIELLEKDDEGNAKVTLISLVEDQVNAVGDYAKVVAKGTAHEIVLIHKVTFDAGEGKADAETARTDKDGKLAELPDAARDGYTFEGWFTAAEGGDAVTADTVFDKDTTVFAHWKKNIVSATPSVKLSTSTYTYNGKVKTPSVKVSVNGTVLTKDNYSVSYGKGRKNVGKYTVKVTLKNDYAGSKTVSFKINPPKSAVKKLKKGKKSFTVYVKKQSKQTSGYQVQYSTSKKFKSPKAKNLTSYKKTKLKVKKLKKHKKYYVRVRTYKKVGKAKYYSSWSSAKSVKTK